MKLKALIFLLCISNALALTFTIDSANYFDGTEYVGYYNSTVAGENFSFPAHSFCIDLRDTVGFGQSFSVRAVNLSDYDGRLADNYWQAGWIALQMSDVTDLAQISIMQRAIWEITTQEDTDPYIHGPEIDKWVREAQLNYQSVDPSRFELYLRDAGVGQNQLVILNVPEPSTYAFIFVGGLALVAFRKWRAA